MLVFTPCVEILQNYMSLLFIILKLHVTTCPPEQFWNWNPRPPLKTTSREHSVPTDMTTRILAIGQKKVKLSLQRFETAGRWAGRSRLFPPSACGSRPRQTGSARDNIGSAALLDSALGPVIKYRGIFLKGLRRNLQTATSISLFIWREAN